MQIVGGKGILPQGKTTEKPTAEKRRRHKAVNDE
jgi:hypothetical protein